MANHAEVIADALVRRGVEQVFGLPGGEIVAFMDACRRAGLRFILTGHENSAAVMAQIVGQITGVPGVCAATLGPGATNLVTGVANAFLDRSPLVAVTAQIAGCQFETMSHQRLALNALFAPITKSSLLLDGRDTCEAIWTSLELACTPRPGPVHWVLPSDVAVQQASAPAVVASSPGRGEKTGGKVDGILDRIAQSERPLLLFGLGVPLAAASAASRLVEILRCPPAGWSRSSAVLSC